MGFDRYLLYYKKCCAICFSNVKSLLYKVCIYLSKYVYIYLSIYTSIYLSIKRVSANYIPLYLSQSIYLSIYESLETNASDTRIWLFIWTLTFKHCLFLSFSYFDSLFFSYFFLFLSFSFFICVSFLFVSLSFFFYLLFFMKKNTYLK